MNELAERSRYPDAFPGMLADGLPGRQDARETLAVARQTLARIEDMVTPN